MSIVSSESAHLFEVKASLDSLALELLRGRFPSVDVEPYYKLSGACVDETTRRDKRYRRNMRGNSSLEALILLSMDMVASAYVLISGKRDCGKVRVLLRDFETLVGDYLESVGILTY